MNSPLFADAFLGNFESKEDGMSATKFTDEFKREAIS